MNCAKCGNALPPNAYFCPVCNEPTGLQQGYTYPDMTQAGGYPPQDGYGAVQPPQYGQDFNAQAPQGYPPPQGGAYPLPQGGAYQQPQQGGAYQQTYAQYGTGVYPPGYQPPYQYGQPEAGGGKVLAALAEIPRAFVDSFTKPAEVMRRQMESRDHITGLAVAGAALLLSFLFGMAVVRGLVGALMGGFSSLTGVSLAGDAASFNQGVGYIAGRVAPGVGGVSALCRLFVIAMPTAVVLVYLCVICKARFSLEMLLGYIAVTALPSLAFLALMLLFAFISPWLSLLPLICSWVVYVIQVGAIIAFVTGRPEEGLILPKIVCCSLGLALSALVVCVVGGALIGNVLERVIIMLANVGSLI